MGFGSALKARTTCGNLRLPMLKTLGAVHHFLAAIRREISAGRMSEESNVWLGCHWSEPRQRWEWDDNSAVGMHLLENFYTQSHDHAPRLRPFMIAKQRSWQDAPADEHYVIMCEEPAEDIQLV
jgi:hypothetical protein